MALLNHRLRIHSKIPRSKANGPGLRAVIWCQGCTLACRDCFNPSMKSVAGGTLLDVDDLFRWLTDVEGIDGVSFSGGEPTDQMAPLMKLLSEIRQRSRLSTLLFSGRSLKEIMKLREGLRLLSLLDVLVDGPFDPDLKNRPGAWPSSSNQTIHFLTSRHTMDDFSQLPAMEVVVTKKGDVVQTGLGWSRKGESSADRR